MKKLKWRKHSLHVHFAGANLIHSKSFLRDRTIELVLECLGDKIDDCPISKFDTFSDGVYNNKVDTFVKLVGKWYEYEDGGMFEYYKNSLNIQELDVKVKEALTLISQTKYATKRQKIMAEHINQLEALKRMKIGMIKSRMRIRKLKGGLK